MLFRSQFLRHNAIFMIGAISVGFLNYAFYPIMGRVLEPIAFGEVQVLFSLFTQITIFLGVLSLLTVSIVANYDDHTKRDRMVAELEKLALHVSVILVIVTAAVSPWLRGFFHFNEALPFVLLAVAVLAGTPLAFRSGFLRGCKKFGLVTIVGLSASVGNIVFSVGLALAGLGSAGVLAGLAAGQFIAFCLAAFFARKQGLKTGHAVFSDTIASVKSKAIKNLKKASIDFKLIAPELRYAGLVLVGSLCVTGLFSLDTVVVKHYFDAGTAGLYAGVATVARIIFYATASVLQVMLPSVKIQAANKSGTGQGNRQLLGKSLALLLAVGGLPLIVFAVFPDKLIGLLMGHDYTPYAHLLPWLGLAMLIIAVFNLLIMYHIALRQYAAGIIAVIGIVATFLLILAHHQTLDQVVANICIGSTLSLVLLGAWSSRRLLTRGQPRTQEGGMQT